MRLGAAVFLAALACACVPPPAALPPRPVAAGPGIVVTAQAVPLNRNQPAQDRLGRFVYAGGLDLTSAQTSRLHGLSDLKVWPDGRLLSVSDEGDLLEARLVLDASGRPSGLAEARLTPLLAEDGRPLPALGKDEADSEGIAELPNGDRLVSLERDDRILLYPARGGPPRRAPAPDVKFAYNLGMEALAQDPAAGPDAYLVGGEASGETWLCRLSAGCTSVRTVSKNAHAGLTALAPLPNGGTAYLIRDFDVLSGASAVLRIVDAQGATVDEMQLARPLTVDNFEGLAALPGRNGAIRFYLISDDNFSTAQRTLLLAFDWRP